jgi:hypothetical protein
LADTNSSSGSINNGTIESQGDINLSSYGKVGSALIRIIGTGAQLFTGSTNGRIGIVEIDKASGTLTLASTITSLGNWTWLSGTVDAGTSTIAFGDTNTITPGPVTYNNVTFGGYLDTQNLNGGTMTIGGTLTLADTNSSTGSVINGAIEAQGNVIFSSYGKNGDVTLNYSGVVTATLTVGTSSKLLSTTHIVAKTGGASVQLLSNVSFSSAGRDFTISSGTMDLNGYDFNVNDVLNVGIGTTLKCNGGEITNPQPVSLVNSGTINCPGYATYDFNWSGAGADANWNNPSNWSGGIVPGASDVVVFQDTYCGATCHASINVAANVRGFRVWSPYSGTITQNVGQSITIGSRGWIQSAGTFMGGNSTINNTGQMTMSGGSFTSTTGTFHFNGSDSIWNTSAGTFNHNSGTVSSDPSGGITSINHGTNQFHHLNLFGWATRFTITGTSTVNGHLQMGTGSGTGSALNVGSLIALGDVTTVSNGIGHQGATGIVHISGTGTQTITGSGAWPSMTINKPSGVANFVGNFSVYGPFVYTAGTVNSGTSAFTFFRAGTGSTTNSPNGLSLYDVTFRFSGTSAGISLNNETLNVTNTLTFNSSGASSTLNSGTLNVTGNVIHSGTNSVGGSVNLILSGTSPVTITPNGALTLPGATTTISKIGGGNVTLLGHTQFNNAGQNLVVTSGALDLAGFNLTVGNNITNGGVIQRGTSPTCGTITQGGSYTGNPAVCP